MVDKFIDKNGKIVIRIEDDGEMETTKEWRDKFPNKKITKDKTKDINESGSGRKVHRGSKEKGSTEEQDTDSNEESHSSSEDEKSSKDDDKEE